ncbi:MAG TPA: PolC-type DNA polymerase III [Firmicutes bacterium]|nr:PolC-type DNA polymerase III [Candidatus Fermentithermobacillaceae bacterium]
MSRVSIEPSSDCPRLTDIIEPGEWAGKDLLSHLVVRSIHVDPQECSWTVVLDVPDRKAWSGISRDVSLDEFEVLLATARQELRKKIAGLDQVKWITPEDLPQTFRESPPKPEGEPVSNGSRPYGNGYTARGASQRTSRRAAPDRSQAVPIKELTGGERGRVTVWGEVVEVDWRTNRFGKVDGTIVVTDRTDSVKVRIHNLDAKMDWLERGTQVVLRGRSGIDRFDSEPMLATNESDIVPCPAECRKDPYPEKRVELHLHTKMSQMDSVLSIGKAVERAKEWGHPAIAVTDHGVVQTFPEAYAEGKKHGVKIIYGLEGYLVEDDEKGRAFHVVLLAKNKTGLRHLYEIVTESHLKHFYRTPRIPRRLLEEKREGLLVGSACEAGELVQALLNGASDEDLRKIASFYDYLEIQPIDNNRHLIGQEPIVDEEALGLLNKRIYDLAKATGRMCVMSGDVHYLDPEDEIYRTILLSGKGMVEGERSVPLHFRSTDELMVEATEYLGAQAACEVVITNPVTLAASIENLRPVPEGSYFPSLPNADRELRHLAEEGAKRIYGDPLPALVEERLEKELGAIIGNGFSSLYMIAIRMVEKSLADGYFVGSRGSVGSSLVATCTGITEVNPLKPHYVCPGCRWSDFEPAQQVDSGFDLAPGKCPECGAELWRDGQDIPFETFMGFHGEKVPDIDLNFSGEEQAEIFKFASELLGEGNVFRAGTIGTIARKTAYGFVKHYAEDRGLTLRRAEETRLSTGLEGVKRTTGQHPGGVMVIPTGMDVLDFTPLQFPADDRTAGAITTHFDYNSISGHLVKVDILGHDDPTVIKMLHELTGIDPLKVPMDDPDTLALFSGANPDDAIGIPEFGTRFVRNMLTETKPSSFGDLVRISGLSHGTDVWANNARDLIKNGTAKFREVIATREDIFLYLMKIGMDSAVAFGIAEKVRKGRPLSEEDIGAMRQASVPEWYVDSCKKISYLFPKAHAAAYVTNAFRIAYFKVHHPQAFAAAYFTFHGSSMTVEHMHNDPDLWREQIDKIGASPNATAKEQDTAGVLEVALDMYRRGVRFGKPSLYKSHSHKYVPEGEVLLPPFVSVPGIGNQAAMAIVNAREEDTFTSVEDFRRRTKLGKRVCEALKKAGVLEGLPEGDQLSLF